MYNAPFLFCKDASKVLTVPLPRAVTLCFQQRELRVATVSAIAKNYFSNSIGGILFSTKKEKKTQDNPDLQSPPPSSYGVDDF
jgi:hypothetical protein